MKCGGLQRLCQRLDALAAWRLAVISTLAALAIQGAAAADGDPVALQVVLTGTPDGGLTGFIQRKSAVPIGAPLPALYASQQLLNAQPYVSGVKLQLFTGDTPMGALLVLADSPVETILQDSVFYRLPAPALAVVNSSVRLNNTEGDQKFGGGRLIVITDGASMAISDSVFQGAQQDGDGGVVWMQSSVLDLSNVTFFNNAATGSGGALYADTDSTLSGTATTFANNSAGSEGGAVYHNGFFPSLPGKANFSEPGANIQAFSAAKVAFVNVSFVRNTATTGGAMIQEYVSGNLVECQFSGNTASAIGGGLAQASTFVELADCSFFGNSAEQHGGAAFQINVIGSVTGTQFAGNTAGQAGGALARVHCRGDLNSSSFMDNSGTQGAGAYLDGCIADNLSDSQFNSGIASAAGGGMYLRDTAVKLAHNMTFTASTAQNGAGLYAESSTIGSISNTACTSGVASENGGGIALNATVVMSLLYDTFQNNTAAQGGGIAAIISQLTVASTKFVNNTAGGGSTAGYAIFSDGGQVTLGIENEYSLPELALAISK